MAVPTKQAVILDLILDSGGNFSRLAPHVHTARKDVGMMSADVKDSTGQVVGIVALRFCNTCKIVYWEEAKVP